MLFKTCHLHFCCYCYTLSGKYDYRQGDVREMSGNFEEACCYEPWFLFCLPWLFAILFFYINHVLFTAQVFHYISPAEEQYLPNPPLCLLQDLFSQYPNEHAIWYRFLLWVSAFEHEIGLLVCIISRNLCNYIIRLNSILKETHHFHGKMASVCMGYFQNTL